MLSFECDYNTGAHPKVLERLLETNRIPQPGYGEDEYSLSAREKLRAAVKCPQAGVWFVSGGTQVNRLAIDALLKPWEGVLAAETGHIATHEAGTVEAGGHKVLTLPAEEGKLPLSSLERFMARFEAEEAKDHTVFPGLVYLSQPTEYGTVYTREELEAISAFCHGHCLGLYLDGARLAAALAAEETGLGLPDYARLCDAFTVGGTKMGALFGEALIFPQGSPEHFFTQIKQHGALLAKGRLLGAQFEALFTDGLYEEIGRHVVTLAKRLRSILLKKGYPLAIDSPTNQHFAVVKNTELERLGKSVRFTVWEPRDENSTVVRFCTAWSTTEEDLTALEELL